ncbi:MAG: HDOD domain-containing protein [Burkholderiales bacterium]
MTTTARLQHAQSQLDASQIDELVKGISIPPRPSLLDALQREITLDDPDPRKIAQIVSRDVAMTAAVLRAVNSPFYGLSRQVESLPQALSVLGLRQVSTLVLGLVLRKALSDRGQNLTRFWDVSAKRSYAMVQLARGLGGVELDMAQTFGLFCDVGIPLLMQRFPDYTETLKRANSAPDRSFCEVEHAAHDTDHALVGALMGRTWGLSQAVCLSIRLHHDYAVFRDPGAAEGVCRLIAMGLVAERAIQLHAGMNASVEWDKGGEFAVGTLMLSDADVDDWMDDLLSGFAAGIA